MDNDALCRASMYRTVDVNLDRIRRRLAFDVAQQNIRELTGVKTRIEAIVKLGDSELVSRIQL